MFNIYFFLQFLNLNMKKIFSLNNYIDKEAECEDEIESKKSNESINNSSYLSLNNSLHENMDFDNINNHKEILKSIIKKEDEEIEKFIEKKYIISQKIKKPNVPFEKENKIIKKVFSKDAGNKNNEKISYKIHSKISPEKHNIILNNDLLDLKASYEKKYKKMIHERSSAFKKDFIKTIIEDNKILQNVIDLNKKMDNEKIIDKKKKFIPYSQRLLNLHSQNSYLNKIKNKSQN